MVRMVFWPGITLFPLVVSLLLALTAPAWAQGSIRHEMLLKKALTGDASAQYMVGLGYDTGSGIDRNQSAAEKWYRKAAEQGLAIAQKNLAELLATGSAGTRNHVAAYKWYLIASPNLLNDLERLRLSLSQKTLAKKMTPEDISKASRLAAKWMRDYSLRTGRPSSAEGNSLIGNSGSAAEQRWTCDKKPIKGPTQKRFLNPCLLTLPVGKWVMIHEQKRTDPGWFHLQAHGGSAFDSRRGRIVLFGSDSHGRNWSNSPLLFDVAKLIWLRLYPDDHLTTYKVNKWGVPVAGVRGNHPWAMHTYGAVSYDTRRDEIIVSSHPRHMRPGRFTEFAANLWPRIKHHPTFVLSLKSNLWRTLPTRSRSFFFNSTSYDTDRGVVIGYGGDGVYSLTGKRRKWRRLARRGYFDHHSNSVYDSKNKVVVVFGDTPLKNSVVLFRPSTGEHRVMPTPGPRPPKDEHAPMAYHPRLERTVVMVDQVPDWASSTYALKTMSAGAWLYDAGKDKWTHIKSAGLNFGLGFNYNMEYDPGHNILLLVARWKRLSTTVWALRLE